MGCADVRLLKTIGSVDFTGQERAALNKLTMPRSVYTAVGEAGNTGLEIVVPLRRLATESPEATRRRSDCSSEWTRSRPDGCGNRRRASVDRESGPRPNTSWNDHGRRIPTWL